MTTLFSFYTPLLIQLQKVTLCNADSAFSAAFNGSRIILRQVSPESEAIFDLILALYAKCQGKWDQLANEASVSAEDLKYFLEYAAQFLGNLGNYKGFGDVKFIPRCPKETFESLASVDDKATTLCKQCVDAIYADESKPGLMHLGFPDKGHLTTYYPDSPNITQTEIETVDKYIGDKGLLPENTRIRKTPDGNFEILIASGISRPPANDQDTPETSYNLPDGKKISLIFGDHREEMAKIALEMKRASTHAANPTQKAMMDAYAKSFGSGSLLAFKESQKLWVKDLGPAVESNIGFIETYRDPAGVRGEWEGFVATVNLERTASFKKLVEAAPEMLPKLPWGKEFEKDVFVPPDFTSLEVVSFASSGIPAGGFCRSFFSSFAPGLCFFLFSFAYDVCFFPLLLRPRPLLPDTLSRPSWTRGLNNAFSYYHFHRNTY